MQVDMPLPSRIQELLDEKDPSWEWKQVTTGGKTWHVARLYDTSEEGVRYESERIAAVIIDQRFLKEDGETDYDLMHAAEVMTDLLYESMRRKGTWPRSK